MRPTQMNWKMLFKIGITLIVGVGVIMFYLVSVEDLHREHVLPKLPEEAHQPLEDIFNKRNLVFTEERAEALKQVFDNRTKERVPSDVGRNSGIFSAEVDGKDVNMNSGHAGLVKPPNEIRSATFKHLSPVIQSHDEPIGSAVHLCVVVCDSRGDETMVMLKSAAMVTHTTIHLVFHIITETQHHSFFQEQLNLWPKVYRKKITYKIYTVTFPNSSMSDSWRKLFKPCASQRLFLPDLLQSVDSLIYVDTDTLFLRSLADLWSHFSLFNQSQLAGLVGEAEDGTAGWYNRFANHPYYGQFGINSGVMLMNLTRLRQTSWLSDIQQFYKKYRLMIPWGDQDLINIFFAAHPDKLFLMSCPWNYRSDHCKYVSNCKQAEIDGVSVLHGSRRMFYADREPAFAAIYNTFRNYHLGDDLQYHFFKVLQDALREAKPSSCGKVSSIFLIQLQKLLERNQEVHAIMERDA